MRTSPRHCAAAALCPGQPVGVLCCNQMPLTLQLGRLSVVVSCGVWGSLGLWCVEGQGLWGVLGGGLLFGGGVGVGFGTQCGTRSIFATTAGPPAVQVIRPTGRTCTSSRCKACLPMATGRLPDWELHVRTCCTCLDQVELAQIAEQPHRADVRKAPARVA